MIAADGLTTKQYFNYNCLHPAGYNTHGHKLRFPPFKKAQFVTECGINWGFSMTHLREFF
jgi:hypothetical protein